MLPIGGSGSQETSECHRSPAIRSTFRRHGSAGLRDGLGRIRGRMDVQLAEPPSQRLLLVQVEGLVAEEEHLVLDQGVVQLLELLVAQGRGEIDAGHLGTDPRRQRRHRNRLEGHAATSLDRPIQDNTKRWPRRQPPPAIGGTPWSGSQRPAGGAPVCQKTSIGMPPRGYQ